MVVNNVSSPMSHTLFCAWCDMLSCLSFHMPFAWACSARHLFCCDKQNRPDCGKAALQHSTYACIGKLRCTFIVSVYDCPGHNVSCSCLIYLAYRLKQNVSAYRQWASWWRWRILWWAYSWRRQCGLWRAVQQVHHISVWRQSCC